MKGKTGREGHCFVFDERTAVDAEGESVTSEEAARLAEQLGPRAGKSLRKRLALLDPQTSAE
jgi:predicted sulfurtransferase